MNMDQIKMFLHDFKNRDNSNAKIEEIKAYLKDIKAKYVSNKDEEGAKAIWCLEQVLEIQNLYLRIYKLIQSEKYYESWCELERCEILIGSLKRHLDIDEKYYLSFINKHIEQYQSLYPYKMFFSPGIINHKKRCNICGQIVSIRNPCGHEVGEIYNGEKCIREVIDAECLEISIVTSPAQKYSVLFMHDEKTGKSVDHYNYILLRYLIKRLQSPFDSWEINWTKIRHPHSNFPNLSRNDKCPCGSGKKYKNCCLEQSGVLMPHCEFRISNPDPDADLNVEYSCKEYVERI